MDVFAFAKKTKAYTVVESAPDVLDHLEKLALLVKFNVAKFSTLAPLADKAFADAKAFERERAPTGFELPRL